DMVLQHNPPRSKRRVGILKRHNFAGEGPGPGVVLHNLAGLAAAHILVGEQEVTVAVEEHSPGTIEALASFDKRVDMRARVGIEPLDRVVAAVADVQEVRNWGRGREDGPALQVLKRQAPIRSAAGSPRVAPTPAS